MEQKGCPVKIQFLQFSFFLISLNNSLALVISFEIILHTSLLKMEIGDAPQAEIKDAKATTEATADTEAKKSKISKSGENVNVSHSQPEEEDTSDYYYLDDGVFSTQERYISFLFDDFLDRYPGYPRNDESFWIKLINEDNIEELNHILNTDYDCKKMANYIYTKILKHPSLMTSTETMDGIFKVAYVIRELN